MNTERNGTRSWVISGLLALIAFVAVFPMLAGSTGTQALALEGVSITGDEAGAVTIPFAAVLLDANADPAGAVVLPIDNAGGGADTFALVNAGGLAVGGYMYVGAVEKFSTIDTGALDAVNNTGASQIIDDLSFSTGVGNAFSAVSIASIITQLPADQLSAASKVTFAPPGATWQKARLASDPVAARTLFWARVSYDTVIAAQTDLQRLTYSPHRIGASSGAAGNANGATVSAGTSGGVAANPINVYQTVGAKFFNGLTGVTSTGATLESAAGLFVGLSSVLMFGDGSAGNATVTVAGDANSVTLSGGVDKVGAAATLTVAPALGSTGLVTAPIATGTYTAAAVDANSKSLLAGTSVVFALDGAAILASGLQSIIATTDDTGLATLASAITSALAATSGTVSATSGTATAGSAAYTIFGGAQVGTLTAVGLDNADTPGTGDVAYLAGTSEVIIARAGLSANLRLGTTDTGGNGVATVTPGTLSDTATVDVAINAALDGGLQITQTGVPVALAFGDLFSVNAGATASLGVHTIAVDLPLNTALNPAFSSASLDVRVVAALTVATANLDIGGNLGPTAGPGEVVTITATLTGADGDVDGTADPAPDATWITWTVVGGTLLTVDADGQANNGIQTGTVNGSTSIQVLSTGVNGVGTVTAVPLGLAIPIQTQMLTYTAAAAAVVPVAASVAVEAGSTSLTVGDSTTLTATVTNDDDSVGAGATGRWSEGVAVSTVTSNVKTTDAAGATSTMYTADAAGDTVVTFTVVSLTGGIVVDTAVSGSVTISATAPVVPEPPAPTIAEQLSATSGYAAWIGSESSTAAAIFADTTSASIIWHWNGTAWESYATLAGGVELPGSVNFDVALGAILFFG